MLQVELVDLGASPLCERFLRRDQLDEVEPIAPPGGNKVDTDVYNSEAFLQNLGEALSRFRLSPSSTRERK